MKIDIKPLSVNEAWQGKRFKTKKYLKYENDLLYLLPNNFNFGKPPYSIAINVGFSNSLSDLDNICKPFLDILQKKYGINDKDIYKLILTKTLVKKGMEFISVYVPL